MGCRVLKKGIKYRAHNYACAPPMKELKYETLLKTIKPDSTFQVKFNIIQNPTFS